MVEICQRLDGVPLAIELAAARVIALSPAELLRRLDRRFQVLAGGRRGAVERHATLRAAIDWSYELWNPPNSDCSPACRCSPEAAPSRPSRRCAAAIPSTRDEVMDLVTGLVARSLVVAEDGSAGTRYRLLETIRQYGEERLAGWTETEALLIRHARFYADLAARAAKHCYGPDQLFWARQSTSSGATFARPGHGHRLR